MRAAGALERACARARSGPAAKFRRNFVDCDDDDDGDDDDDDNDDDDDDDDDYDDDDDSQIWGLFLAPSIPVVAQCWR